MLMVQELQMEYLMRIRVLSAAFLAALSLCLCPAGWAVDFFFQPDTANGNVGDTVTLAGRIGPTELLRGFTVYMAYDTNVIDLAAAPVPGTLIAGRPGLDFRYLDHVPVAPHRLEISATIFGSSFWAGPGEIFRARFVLRRCADQDIVAPSNPFFLSSTGVSLPVTYDPASVLICPRVPAAPLFLTIAAAPLPWVTLYWQPVATDTLGRSLLAPVEYRVFRQQVLPSLLPPVLVITLSDTTFSEPLNGGVLHHYYVQARTPD